MMMKTAGYIEAGNAKLYYERAGQGETVVLCHAGVADSRMWADQWPVLSQHYEVVRFDMRGFGQSDAATGPVCRRDDLQALLTQLGLDQVHLVGCSLGGEMVLDYALEHPDRVLSLTLVAAVPSGFEMQGEPPAELLAMFGAMEAGDLALVSELQTRLWVDGPQRQPEQVAAAFRQQAAEMNRAVVDRQTWQVADIQPLNPLDPPAAQRLDAIRQPVLIVAGALDNSEILRAADVMAQGFADQRKVILPDCAHLPNMEQPQAFNTALLDFLDSL